MLSQQSLRQWIFKRKNLCAILGCLYCYGSKSKAEKVFWGVQKVWWTSSHLRFWRNSAREFKQHYADKVPSRLLLRRNCWEAQKSYLKLSELAYQILSRKEKWITMMRLMNTMTMNCSRTMGEGPPIDTLTDAIFQSNKNRKEKNSPDPIQIRKARCGWPGVKMT